MDFDQRQPLDLFVAREENAKTIPLEDTRIKTTLAGLTNGAMIDMKTRLDTQQQKDQTGQYRIVAQPSFLYMRL